MKRSTAVMLVLAVLLLGALGSAAAFFAGGTWALNGMRIASATPDQLVAAMGSDDFYGQWRERTLVVTGSVIAVTTEGTDTIAEFKTHSVLKAYCNMGASPDNAPKAGDTVSVITEGLQAQRLPNGVMLERCMLL